MGLLSKLKAGLVLVEDEDRDQTKEASSSRRNKTTKMNLMGMQQTSTRTAKKKNHGENQHNVHSLEVTKPKMDNPVELGHIHFLRNLKDGYELSRETRKPIFLLFQEIPGCRTCTNFGRDILQNEKMVRAIAHAFIPVAINNRCLMEADARTCSRFNEPMLNNPVVRFIDVNGKDLVPRQAGIYSRSQLIPRMKQALSASGREDLLHHLP